MPVEVFVSYAHEDERLWNKLRVHLEPLQRHGLISIWHDRKINAGVQWQCEINNHLNTAQIILLLVSPDFMASNYCYSIEMKRAMERHEKGEVRVVPIILRPVHGWKDGPLGKLEALPTDAYPVTQRTKWHSQDEAFSNVAEGIHRIIERWEEIKEAGSLTETLAQVGTVAFNQNEQAHLSGKGGPQFSQSQQVSKIKVAISSTADLLPDRDVIVATFKQIPFINIVVAGSSDFFTNNSFSTREVIEESDLFILLIGGSLGHPKKGGKAPIELEFDRVYKSDPTKILVVQKDTVESSPEQKKFLKQVSKYYKDDWIVKYASNYELPELITECFALWIKNRASAGHQLTYLDHFVRFAIQRKPISTTETFYSVNEDYIELKYKMFGKIYILHLSNEQIYKDFWGCLAHVDEYCKKCGKERHDRDF